MDFRYIGMRSSAEQDGYAPPTVIGERLIVPACQPGIGPRRPEGAVPLPGAYLARIDSAVGQCDSAPFVVGERERVYIKIQGENAIISRNPTRAIPFPCLIAPVNGGYEHDDAAAIVEDHPIVSYKRNHVRFGNDIVECCRLGLDL